MIYRISAMPLKFLVVLHIGHCGVWQIQISKSCILSNPVPHTEEPNQPRMLVDHPDTSIIPHTSPVFSVLNPTIPITISANFCADAN